MKGVAFTVIAATAVGIGCGGDPGFGLGVTLQGLNPSQIGAVQISVLKNGSTYNCATLSHNCLNAQVSKSAMVPVIESDGSQHTPAVFVVDGTQVAGSGEPLTMSLPVGQDYLLVAEILPPTQDSLLASGCTFISQVTQSGNAALSVTALAITPAPTCNPLFQ